jgi:hypothetical protein
MGDTDAMIHRQSRIDDAKGFETVRALRWPDDVLCPTWNSSEMTQPGRDETQPERPRSLCPSCERRVDAGTDTLCAGHHPPLRVWRLCLYCLGLHLSTHHMAAARALHPAAVHQRPCPLRQGRVVTQPTPPCSDAVACDEVSIVAGHTGTPEAVGTQGGAAGAAGARAGAAGAHSPQRSRRSAGGFSGGEPW